MSRRTQLWGTIFSVFWVLLLANPLPPTPSSKPLTTGSWAQEPEATWICLELRNLKQHEQQTKCFHCAAKEGKQKGTDHFVLFRSPFGNLFTFLTFRVTFLPLPFCLCHFASPLLRQGDIFIDLLMGLFRGAVFQHGGVPENSPLTLMGRFSSLMGRFRP